MMSAALEAPASLNVRRGVRDTVEWVTESMARQDWAEVLAVHAEDAVWERKRPTGWRVRGGRAIADFLERSQRRIQVIFRVVSVVQVDLRDPWTAVARCRVSEVVRDRESGASLHLVGTYEDQLVRRSGRWLIVRRLIDLDKADFLRASGAVGRR